MSGDTETQTSSTVEPFEHFARIAVALSQARTMDAIAEIVRHASRELVGSDGATFVLKDRDMCHYLDEDAIAPLCSIDGFSDLLLSDYEKKLDDTGKDYLRRVRAAATKMGLLIDDLLKLSRVSKHEMNATRIDLSHMVRDILKALAHADPDRRVESVVQDGVVAYGDHNLIRIAFENLLNNAWKYTGKREDPSIKFGGTQEGPKLRCFVRDNGAGFDSQRAEKLFSPFQRLHSEREFPGTGIGLATVQRILHRHGGAIRAEGRVDGGAAFYVTLPLPSDLN